MPRRPCLDCGTPTNGDRCPLHRQAQRAKYGRTHQAERATWSPLVNTGTIRCTICHQPIDPGTPWDLGHVPPPIHPQHARCNRQHAALGYG